MFILSYQEGNTKKKEKRYTISENRFGRVREHKRIGRTVFSARFVRGISILSPLAEETRRAFDHIFESSFSIILISLLNASIITGETTMVCVLAKVQDVDQAVNGANTVL